MLKLLLLDILGIWADPSIYRNFNVSGIDVENRNSMLEPLESNPMLSITTSLLETPMMSSLDHSHDDKKKTDKPKKTKKPTNNAYEEDSQSSVSLNTKTKEEDDNDSE